MNGTSSCASSSGLNFLVVFSRISPKPCIMKVRCYVELGAHGHDHPGSATEYTVWASSQGVFLGWINTPERMKSRKTSHLCDELHTGRRIRYGGLDVCKLFLLGALFPPVLPVRNKAKKMYILLTVSSLISVDFPAPLGPMIPTRL